jgi:tetratricopeptide (TPR) repeat protein
VLAWPFTLLLVVTAEGARSASDDASSPPSIDDYAAAERLYEDGDFEQAILRLQRAARAAPATGADAARVHVLLALSYLQTYDEATASAHFEEALVADRGAALPSYAPPRAMELFAQVRDRLAPAVSPPATPPPAVSGAAAASPRAPEGAPPTWQLPMGIALVGVATGALLISVVAFVAAGEQARVARDVDAYQLDALAAADAANVQIGVGAGLVVLAVASFAGGVGVFALPAAEPSITARSSSP